MPNNIRLRFKTTDLRIALYHPPLEDPPPRINVDAWALYAKIKFTLLICCLMAISIHQNIHALM